MKAELVCVFSKTNKQQLQKVDQFEGVLIGIVFIQDTVCQNIIISEGLNNVMRQISGNGMNSDGRVCIVLNLIQPLDIAGG